ncbi:MAG TPA: phasin family protein [Caldimonas sp.]|nr:phasin family protein [Caldimonas sp.]
MVKKLKAMADKQKRQASAAGLLDSELAKTVRESAQQIWLAGMGAFAKAQAEGKQRFEALVKEGASLQKKTQNVAEEKLGEVTSRMTSMADDVTSRAGQHWDKLESIFEERTAKALKKLGVPSSRDVQALQDKIDALSAQVAGRRQASAAAAKKAGGAKKAAGKTTRRSAAKKSARSAA